VSGVSAYAAAPCIPNGPGHHGRGMLLHHGGELRVDAGRHVDGIEDLGGAPRMSALCVKQWASQRSSPPADCSSATRSRSIVASSCQRRSQSSGPGYCPGPLLKAASFLRMSRFASSTPCIAACIRSTSSSLVAFSVIPIALEKTSLAGFQAHRLEADGRTQLAVGALTCCRREPASMHNPVRWKFAVGWAAQNR